MRRRAGSLLVLALALAAMDCPLPAQAASGAAELTGRWKGAFEMGKFRMRLELAIVRTNSQRIAATISLPDQGARDMPVSAVLFNAPEVRMEFDMFGTAFGGRLSPDGRTITGEMEEGPGGRPMPLTFERDDSPDRPEPARSYAAGPEEPPDLRGYWLASVEAMPGLAMRTALRIGRLPDGSFEALLDRFDHGLRDAPAKSVQLTNGGAKLEWEFLHATLNARLSTNGSELTGTWAEGPRDIPVTFRRLPRPGTIVPEDTSFTPEAGRPADLRGEWRGTLDAGGTRLRIVLKTGRLPDGSLVATLTSPDQGNGEFLASSVGQTPPAVKAEWKALRAVFNATLAGDGHELSGTWEQGGRPLPLRLTRVPATSPEPAKPAQP